MITLHFTCVRELVDWMPAAPDFVEGDGAWQTREFWRMGLNLSESGFDKLRRELGKPYEHKDRQGRVWIYSPYWWRVYLAWYSAQRQK